MPQDWPIWLSIPVLGFGVLSFIAVWAITICGVVRELRGDPQGSTSQWADMEKPQGPTGHERRGE